MKTRIIISLLVISLFVYAGSALAGTETGLVTYYGLEAGFSDIGQGWYNTFIGRRAGYSNSYGDNNTFVGHYSGYTNTTGYNNTFIGYQVGYYNTSGYYNTFVGNQAGMSNTTGRQNTFIGLGAGANNTSAIDSTFVGYYAGVNSNGQRNSFLGRSAGASNTSGFQNTFLGYTAGASNTTADNNTFVGSFAGWSNTTADNNTFVGSFAGYSNSTGGGNVFLGYYAGYSETGSNKLYIDNSSTSSPLIWGDFSNNYVNINGSLGVGTSSPSSPLTVVGMIESTSGGIKFPDATVQTTAGGGDITSVAAGTGLTGGGTTGAVTLNVNFSGSGVATTVSRADHTHAGADITSGTVADARIASTIARDSEVMPTVLANDGSGSTLDADLLDGQNSSAFMSATTDNWVDITGDTMTGSLSVGGNINTSGEYSIDSITVLKTETTNTYLGKNAGYSATGSGNVFLGYQAGYNETGSNILYIDNSSTGTPLIYGEFDNDIVEINGDLYVTGNAYLDSDKKLKEDIKPIQSSLDKINNIKGVSFAWKDEEKDVRGKHYGVIAQEIEEVIPEIVRTGKNGIKKVAYMELIPVLIEAVKEQHKKDMEQSQIIKDQQTIISKLSERLNELEREVKLKGSLVSVIK